MNAKPLSLGKRFTDYAPKTGALIAVSGLPGVGKTTLCERLADKLKYRAAPESISDNPFLQPFFDNPKHNTFHLEMWFLQFRHEQYLKALRALAERRARGVVLDRTLWDGLAFIRTLRAGKRLTRMDAEVYQKIFKIVTSTIRPPPIYVFLDCSARTAHGRMAQRGRSGEADGLKVDYLERLRGEYRRLMSQLQKQGTRVIFLSWERFLPEEEVI
ncbi:MAG: deoxynucleoside kinase, partial [Elusimicrobia bacterium]|nr:deoxynucleoside kinase [Elusimicrobiota bacterium]